MWLLDDLGQLPTVHTWQAYIRNQKNDKIKLAQIVKGFFNTPDAKELHPAAAKDITTLLKSPLMRLQHEKHLYPQPAHLLFSDWFAMPHKLCHPLRHFDF
ncbi:hypothetical protein ACTACT_10035 [Pseudomonas syringae]|uniref:hypothetical protein n=1 Tax=Pseudomonas syringae TaxID=317 RepID=UPI003F752B18